MRSLLQHVQKLIFTCSESSAEFYNALPESAPVLQEFEFGFSGAKEVSIVQRLKYFLHFQHFLNWRRSFCFMAPKRHILSPNKHHIDREYLARNHRSRNTHHTSHRARPSTRRSIRSIRCRYFKIEKFEKVEIAPHRGFVCPTTNPHL